jgi:hypothetical protein
MLAREGAPFCRWSASSLRRCRENLIPQALHSLHSLPPDRVRYGQCGGGRGSTGGAVRCVSYGASAPLAGPLSMAPAAGAILEHSLRPRPRPCILPLDAFALLDATPFLPLSVASRPTTLSLFWCPGFDLLGYLVLRSRGHERVIRFGGDSHSCPSTRPPAVGIGLPGLGALTSHPWSVRRRGAP